MQNLPVSRLINVGVNLEPSAGQSQDLSTLLVLGSSDVIDVVQRMRTYTSIAEVAADFGTSAPEYLAALLYFGQTPQPRAIDIGRWAKTASKGVLVCGGLSAAHTLISFWSAIANGSFHITFDGASPISVTALDTSGAANLSAVAALITAKLTGEGVCTYDPNSNLFRFESVTTGPTSAVSFLTAGTGGTDVSADLAGLSTSSGAYEAPGIALESALAAVTIFDDLFGQQWYALTIPEAVDNDHIAVGGYIEASNNKHLYGVSSTEAGILSSVSTTDIAYVLKALGLKRTIVQYSSSSVYVVASFLGRAITVNWNGNNTAITMMYKQEPDVVAEQLTSSQADALEAKNCNVFAAYNNDTAIVEQGKCCSGDFVDEITGTDWLAVTIMGELYNLLYTSPTKIPQTDPGANLLVTTAAAVCSQGVTNGLLAPGVWTSQGFGTLKQNDFLSAGFYVYAPPVASQSRADRAARKSVPIQIAAKLAGAVHTVDVTINVNR